MALTGITGLAVQRGVNSRERISLALLVLGVLADALQACGTPQVGVIWYSKLPPCKVKNSKAKCAAFATAPLALFHKPILVMPVTFSLG